MADGTIQRFETDETRNYWGNLLRGLEPCLFPRLVDKIPSEATSQSIIIDLQDTASAIRAFCSDNDITTTSFFQTVWALVLRCYTGTDQPCFGYEKPYFDIAENRAEDRLETTDISSICHSNLSPDLTLRQVLKKLQMDHENSLQHQPCPLDSLNERKDLVLQSMFNTTLVVEELASTAIPKMIKSADVTKTSRYAILIRASISETNLSISILYDTSILSNDQAVNMVSTTKAAIKNVLENSHQSVGGISLFSDNDWNQIMVWNQKMPDTINMCAHQKIKQQVMQNPDALAVCAWDGTCTYRELDQKSTNLAHHLVAQGVKPDVIIPLCFEKSVWAIVAMLAVMKAGGAIVFLDPAHPMARLEDLMSQIDAKLVLTSLDTAALWETRAQVVIVSQKLLDSLEHHAEMPKVEIKPTNILYVVFTSGSTGKPKGCVIEHASFLTGAINQGSYKGFIDPTSRIMQIASYSFDVSILEILTSLIFGACICVPYPPSLANGLASVMRDMDINWAFLTPSLARIISPDDVPSLRVLVLGGEALSKEDVDVWSPRVLLANGYGPSECSIAATVNPKMTPSTDPANIGRSMGSLCWVVEPWDVDRLVPIGGVGELLIEGPILARGYYKDSKKTRSAFIENPAWSQTPASRKIRRFYKTGDLVRNNADGTINFIGRKDTQVKLRGQRIELGEIEHHVKKSIPTALDAAVELVVTANRPDDPILAAFFNFPSGAHESTESKEIIVSMSPELEVDLREAEKILRASMPSYMVPSLYIPLNWMPRTVAGKRDRNQLRDAASKLSSTQLALYALASTEKRAPSTAIETTLQRLWGEVLSINTELVGADDNFFRIGGDSIAAMKLVTAAHREGIKLEVADIFRNPVLSQMGEASRAGHRIDTKLEDIAPFSLLCGVSSIEQLIDEIATECTISKESIQDAYPCTPLQEGLVALSIKEPNAYMAQHVFTLSEEVDTVRFREAWSSVQETTEALRTRVAHTALSGSIQVVTDSPIAWRQSTDLKSYLDEDISIIYRTGSEMLRFALIEDPDSRQNRAFVLTAHHALYDGWSLPLILEKVALTYASAPVEAHTPFKHFVKYLIEADDAAQDNFWKRQLTNAIPSRFPIEHETQGQPRSQDSLTQKFYMPRTASKVPSVTMPTIIRAAWALVVARYSNTTDVVFGATVAGRNAPVLGLAQMPGPTIATVPVRVAFSKQQTIVSFLEQVQEQATEMMSFEHQGLQNIKRLGDDISRACDFQSLLVVQPLIEYGMGSDLWGSDALLTKVDDTHTMPLVVECTVDDRNVLVVANYDATVVTKGKLHYILSHFETALHQLLEEPAEQTLSEVDLFGQQDKSQILKWNQDIPGDLQVCVHELFEQQVQLRPERFAVHSWDAKFTYRELESLSNRLAKNLVNMGVGPEVLVPLCFDKSAWMIVAILGVLKAGGACVALEPKHPTNRIREIIQSTAATIVLTARHYAHMFQENLTVVIEDSTIMSMVLDTEFKSPLLLKCSHPAFVVFTSGSTGTPKGIVLEHHAVSTTAIYQAQSMQISADSRVFQFAAYTFDISIGDIASALSQGACLCIPSEEERMNDVTGSIQRLCATWACLTPTVSSMIQPEDVPSLKVLVLAGEAPSQNNIVTWSEKVFLVNAYGPAEGTIWSTCHTDVQRQTVSTNIGRGLGTKVWVVDASNHNKLCPIGCVGELVIEGPSLARGYLNDPEKTAASFIENPVWFQSKTSLSSPSRKFYKTGDLVQYNMDGTLNFLGRKDTQIKLHGLRIELGEIEHHIKSQLPRSNVAVELISTSRSKEPVLATFFTVTENVTATTDDIVVELSRSDRSEIEAIDHSLSHSLPVYMIPSLYVPVKYLPTTVSGKLDRLKLREIGKSLSSDQLIQYTLSESQKRPPTTSTEKALQELWAKVLNVSTDSIGVDDTFFRLGGDSVAAMQLVSLARTQNLAFTVEDVFRQRTLYGLALLAQSGPNKIADALAPFSLINSQWPKDYILKEVLSQCHINADIVQDVYPCTPLQESLVLLSSQQPGAYIAQFWFRLPRSVDLDTFKAAWQTLSDMENILRTRIVYTHDAGSFQAVIADKIEWNTASTSVKSYLEKDRLIPVTYGSQLSRYALIEDEQMPEDYHFVWTVHHALYDGWSVNLMLKKVMQIYRGEITEDSTPFTKFIEYLQDADAQTHEEYWTSYLNGANCVQFPSSQMSILAERQEETLTHNMSFSRQSGTNITLSTIVRAAWALVIAQHSDTNDVVFGATLSGRNAPVPDVASMLGPTITTVPVRVSFEQEQTVTTFLNEVQNQSINMMPFEHTGLQKIKRLNTDSFSACTFQNLLVVQPQATLGSENDTVESFNLEVTDQPNFNSYPLVLECNLGQEAMKLDAFFDSNVISPPNMQRTLHRLELIIHQLAEASESTTVGDIDMLLEEERTQIWEWNSKMPTATEECIHLLVRKQVLARPKAPAVCSWDGHLNYKQLDDLSTRLAYQLVRFGIKPEDYVPLCFDKSLWTVVAMLAVLKAGGAYVAMDPAFPVGRLRDIVTDLEAKVMLAGPSHSGSFSDLVDHMFVLEQESMDRLPPSHKTQPCSTVQPENAAFVVYTSGSTGKPKGIVLEHRGLVTVASENGSAMNFRHDSRVLQFAAYSFDVSNCEIFTTLIHGGCICIPSEDERLNDLTGAINKMHVNWAFLTPTVAGILKPSDLPCLKTLTLGGEAIKKDVLDRWQEKVLVINSYGPAECTIWSSHALLRHDISTGNIGSGVGSILWIADPLNHNKLAPIGSIGELLVEGPIVSRGYLNDPVRTANAFVEDVTWLGARGKNRRLYKTGDLVRYNEDGSLEYVGRKDTQVKVRGQRVELGEIEYHLSVVGHIQDAVALLPKRGRCIGNLVALLSLSTSSLPNVAGARMQIVTKEQLDSAAVQVSILRENLAERVPSFMVPAIWIIVEALPLTMSGKIHRKQIAEWVEAIDEKTFNDVLQHASGEGLVSSPVTAVENKLQKLWSQVLNLSPVQVNMRQSFLSFGGDSITAMQLVSSARAEGIELHVRDILKSQNIPQLALSLGRSSRDLRPIADHVEERLSLSPIQQWHMTRDPSGDLRFNQSVLLRITMAISPDDVLQAINTIIQRHSMLRSRFQQSATGEWTQRVTEDYSGSYTYHSHDIPNSNHISAIASKAQDSLNIRDGPLLAADLIMCGESGQLLHLVIHHLVIDLVSWRIMLQELEQLLQHKTLVADKPFPFQEWVRIQADFAHQRLGPHGVLPYEIPMADFQYWDIDTRRNLYGDLMEAKFSIDADTTSSLVAGCHMAMKTEPLDVLIGALSHSFKEVFSDRFVPPVYLEGHGREPWEDDINLSRTVGWFTSMYPVHVSLETKVDVVAAVRQAKDIRRRIPANGWRYFNSRFLNAEGIKRFANHDLAEIVLNYEGLYQQAERADAMIILEDLASEDMSPLLQRPALFEVSVAIKQGTTHVCVGFNRQMSNQDRIHDFIRTFQLSIEEAVASLSQMEAEPTVSDYPLLSMSHDSFKKLYHEQLPQAGLQSLVGVDDIYPCSPMQEGILLSQQKSSGLYEVYDVTEIVVPEGHEGVDIPRLKDAWRRVVNRHSTLRTIFVQSNSEDGLFHQVALKHVSPRILDINCDADEALTMLQAQAPAEHLGDQPLHQLTICRSPQGQVFCKLEMSHVLVDAASRSFIYRDFTLAYEGKLGATQGLPYSQYIKYLSSIAPEPSIEYWNTYLDGIVPCHFPVLHDGIEQERELLKSVKFKVSSTQKISQFAQENNLTLANIFQVVWGLVLHAYTGSDQVCFGYVTAGRDISVTGIDMAVGPYINMLICRLDMKDQNPLLQVLKAVQESFLDSLPHQHCSLARIQHRLNLSGQALFNSVMSFQSVPHGEEEFSNLISFNTLTEKDPTEYDIGVNIEMKSGEILVNIKYWNSCLSDGQARNLLGAFETAVESITDSPDRKIEEVNLFGREHEKQISTWNSVIPKGVDTSLRDLIAIQTEASPQAQALCAWDGQFTYAELDVLTTQLACHLVSLGVGVEVKVPFCFEKSAWAVVSMLSIIKAGGAFVALDPSHPVDRLRSIINKTNASLVITAPSHTHLLKDLVSNVLSVELSLFESLPLGNAEDLPSILPSNAALVVFTSGSTGEPKGIVTDHRAICTSLLSLQHVQNRDKNTRVFQFASYIFDVSISDVFITMISGGCICVPSEHDRLNNLAGAMNQMQVNWAHLTSTVASLLRPSDVPGLKTLVLGGEAVSKDNVQTWASAIKLILCYGPAECSVTCAGNSFVTPSSNPSKVGHPTASVFWVVNPSNHNQLVPIGCAGELLVDGPVLAREYLQEAELTAASFITNPSFLPAIDSNTTRRLYKTGDLVRQNSDGTINIIGRKDRQVKLHGQRIELSAIEYSLRQELKDATDIAVEMVRTADRPNDDVLAAFFCCRPDTLHEAHENKLVQSIPDSLQRELIRADSKLADILPTYMIPSLYIPLISMPVMASGKRDKKILQQLVIKLSSDQVSHYALAETAKLAPTTDSEKKLRNLWAQVLNLSPDSIGADDNFFRLGGDSITAMRLVAAASEQLLCVTVSDIFRHPSLCEMALRMNIHVEDANAVSEKFGLLQVEDTNQLQQVLEDIAGQCEIDKDDIEDVYPCTALQEGLLALSVKQPGSYTSQHVFSLSDTIDIPRLRKAWETIVETTDTLKTRIVFSRVLGALQVVVKGNIQWETVTSLEEYAQNGESQICYGKPLSWFGLVDSGNDTRENHLVWTAHHALYDGASMGIILKQVMQAYEQMPITKSVPFKGFIQHLAQRNVTIEYEYWNTQLQGVVKSNFPQVSVDQFQNRSNRLVKHKLPISESQNSHITRSNMIRAAWALIIAGYCDANDVVFGATLTGRNAPVCGIDRMPGPTITTVPVRIGINYGQTVGTFLEAIQSQSTEMIPFEHTGLQNIRRLGPDAQNACDFQNLLVIQPHVSEDETSNEVNMMNLQRPATTQTAFHTYPLVLSCSIGDDSIDIEAHFNQNALATKQIETIIYQFGHVLKQLNSMKYTQLVGEIEQLSPEDKSQIANWNSKIPTTSEHCVHQIIERHTALFPMAPAICSWDGNFSYHDVDRLSSILARYLVSLGVVQETPVTFCFSKSAWAVIAMQSILKAGGACVALDPTESIDRLRSIVKNVDAKILITAPQYSDMLDGLAHHIIPINTEFFNTDRAATSKLPLVLPENGAIIDFTGKQEGVVVEHQSLCANASAMQDVGSINQKSRVLQCGAYTSNISSAEIFLTMMAGGCVCVPSEYDISHNLAGAVKSLNANWAHFSPKIAAILKPSDVPNLKTLVLDCGTTKSTVHAWSDALRLIICYSAIECGLVCAANTCVTTESDPNNVGHSLGSLLWITETLNHNRLAPIGCVGELLVEGPVLAREYLNDGRRTDAVLVTNPSFLPQTTPQQSRCLYKTGQLARYNLDGTINLVGRKDEQTRFHGQRINLAEIENHLKRLAPGVSQVAVELASFDSLKDQVFVAFFSYSDFNAADEISILPPSNEIRSGLIEAKNNLVDLVPPHEIPSLYIPLKHIPMNGSGNIDRGKLRAFISTLRDLGSYTLTDARKRNPATYMERLLQRTWASLLAIDTENIGLDDNFFRSGGDSVGAMRLVAALREENVSLSVANIFQKPKLFEMARIAEMIDASDTDSEADDHSPFALIDVNNISSSVTSISNSESVTGSKSATTISVASSIIENKSSTGSISEDEVFTSSISINPSRDDGLIAEAPSDRTRTEILEIKTALKENDIACRQALDDVAEIPLKLMLQRKHLRAKLKTLEFEVAPQD